MIDLILLSVFSFALYRMAVSYNITPWKWIVRYVLAFIASLFAFAAVMMGIYGEGMMKDTAFVQKMGLAIEPFMLLYQFVLFFFFRTRIVRYVHNLDLIEKGNDNNNVPNPPAPKKNKKDTKEQKDFSYFR
jgi:hypothetical protein